MAVGDLAKIAALSYVAFGKETTWGTYNSATTAAEFLSCSFRTDVETKKLDQIGWNRGFSHRVTLGKMVGGTLEQYLHPVESVLLIANALGGHIVSTSQTAASIHSITTGNFDTVPSIGLSFNVRKGETHTWRYSGGRCNVMKLSGNVGEPIMASFEFIFKDATQVSDDISAALQISGVAPFTFVNGVFRYANSETVVNTTTAEEPIQSFELTVNNNLKSESEARQLGTSLLGVLPPTRREVEFKITNRFDTTTTWLRFIQATQGSVELKFVGQAISAEYNNEMTIRLPKVFNVAGDPEIGGAEEILTTEIPFDVLLNDAGTTTGRDIGVTIKNAVTAY